MNMNMNQDNAVYYKPMPATEREGTAGRRHTPRNSPSDYNPDVNASARRSAIIKHGMASAPHAVQVKQQ